MQPTTHPTPTTRTLAAAAGLLLALGTLGACADDDGADQASPAAEEPATGTDGEPTEEAPTTPEEGAPETDGDTLPTAPGAATTPLDRTDLSSVWAHAVTAIASGDEAAFLEVAAPEVLERMQQANQGEGVAWCDWDVMGGRGMVGEARPLDFTITAGACQEGFEEWVPHVLDVGAATHQCTLDFTDHAGGSPDSPMGLFLLTPSADGTWTVTAYTRMYN